MKQAIKLEIKEKPTKKKKKIKLYTLPAIQCQPLVDLYRRQFNRVYPWCVFSLPSFIFVLFFTIFKINIILRVPFIGGYQFSANNLRLLHQFGEWYVQFSNRFTRKNIETKELIRNSDNRVIQFYTIHHQVHGLTHETINFF